MFVQSRKSGKENTAFSWKVIAMDAVLLFVTTVVLEQVILQYGWFADDLAFFYVNIILTAVKLFCKGVIIMIVLLLLWLQAIVM